MSVRHYAALPDLGAVWLVIAVQGEWTALFKVTRDEHKARSTAQAIQGLLCAVPVIEDYTAWTGPAEITPKMGPIPCPRCADGDHEHCTQPLSGGPGSGFLLGCCCDLLDPVPDGEP